MLLEGAVGDSYGAGFEYADPRFVQRHITSNRYIQHPRHKLKPGSYTDDTQMSIALAELIVEKLEWTPENIARKFVECFKRDQRQGYASNFYNLLCEVKDGDDLLARIKPDSEKSGGAMRACCVAWIGIGDGKHGGPAETVKHYAGVQAKITHNTERGIAAAEAAACMAFYLHRCSNDKKDLATWLRAGIPIRNWEEPWTEPVGALGLDAVHAAVTAVLKHDSLLDILKACISYTGDVDTVATIALQAASGSREVKKDLPNEMVEGLENGTYGREYLMQLDQKLIRS